MAEYRMLAVDIDGTLVNSADALTPGVRKAVRQAQTAGLKVVLVTGRRYRRALPLSLALELDTPLVTASGALIKQPWDHHTLHCAEIDRPALLATLMTLHAAGHEAVVYSDTYHLGFDFYVAPSASRRLELAEYLRLNAGSERVVEALMLDPPAAVFAGFAIGCRGEMLELSEHLQQTVPGALYTHVLRSPLYSGFMCEISRAGSTKWSAVKRLAEGWGIDDREICAVGDDVNDLPMLQAAGLGVAMGNALPEVKAAAHRVAPTNDEDGLAAVVRWALNGDRA